MQEMNKRLSELEGEFLQAYEKLGIAEKVVKVEELEKQVAEPEIWKDVKVAAEKNQELAQLSEEVQPWELLGTQINDLKELIDLSDEDLKEEIEGQIVGMEQLLI